MASFSSVASTWPRHLPSHHPLYNSNMVRSDAVARFPDILPPISDESNSESADDSPHGTTVGSPAPRVRRRRVETLESIRHSIFGGRKKSPSIDFDWSNDGRSRSSSRAGSSSRNAARPETPFVQTNSEVEYYHHLKKASISPPFNFSHVSHAAKKSIPSLDTVDEQELQHHFRKISSTNVPPGELQDIEAEMLSQRRQLEERCRPNSPSPRPSTPSSTNLPPFHPPQAIASILFDESQDTRFDPTQCAASLVRSEQPRERDHIPRQSLTLALDQAEQWLSEYTGAQQILNVSTPPSSPPQRTGSTDSEGSSELTIRDGNLSARSVCAEQPIVASEKMESFPLRRPAMVMEAPEIPLPPSPLVRDFAQCASRESLTAPSSSHLSVISYFSSNGALDVPRSVASSQRSPEMSEIGDLRQLSKVSDFSWEDEIDLMYEVEAEANCDFDWKDVAKGSDQDACSCSEESSAKLSDLVAAFPVPVNTLPPRNNHHIRQKSSVDGLHYMARPNAAHRREISVGHLGFLTARSASCEALKIAALDTSPRVKIQETPSIPTTPSMLPIPTTPSLLQFEDSELPSLLSGSKTVDGRNGGDFYFASFDPKSGHLSDPELSARLDRSKHRKSSSYSSYGSSSRLSQGSFTKYSARWSIASASGLPELLHSSKTVRSSLNSAISHNGGTLETANTSTQPTPTVGTSPETDKALPPLPLCAPPPVPVSEDNTSSVSTAPATPIKDTMRSEEEEREAEDEVPIMRRPQSPGERAALQAAGSAVRRSRPPRPHTSVRFSQATVLERPHAIPSVAPAGWI